MWKDGDATHLLPGQTHMTYDYRETVYGHAPVGDVTRTLSNGEFEKDRQTSKKRCSVQAARTSCAGQAPCSVSSGLRIPLTTVRRAFTPSDRSNYQGEGGDKHRTVAVGSTYPLGFELHTLRGLKKMPVRSA